MEMRVVGFMEDALRKSWLGHS